MAVTSDAESVCVSQLLRLFPSNGCGTTRPFKYGNESDELLPLACVNVESENPTDERGDKLCLPSGR